MSITRAILAPEREQSGNDLYTREFADAAVRRGRSAEGIRENARKLAFYRHRPAIHEGGKADFVSIGPAQRVAQFKHKENTCRSGSETGSGITGFG